MSARKRLAYNWNPLLQAEIRRAKRGHQLGEDAACASCGERTRAVLTRVKGEIRCYACRVDEGPRRDTEVHHPLGRARAPHHTVVVSANDNQLFNDPDDGREARLRWHLEPSKRLTGLLTRR